MRVVSSSLGSALVVLACAVLASCGGGGGGGGDSSSGGSRPTGTLSVSATTLTFVAGGVNSPAPAPQTISGTVTGVTSGNLYVIVTGDGPAVSSISSVSVIGNTGSAIVTVPQPSVIGPGTHTATITIRACLDDQACNSGNLTGSPKVIDVVYHVAVLSSSASSLSYSIGNDTVAADLVRNVTITGSPPQTFNAFDDVDWLTVNSGNTGGPLAPTITTRVTDAMFNGIYTAEILVNPGTLGNQVRIPVTLTINRTSVNHVSPYVAYAGTAQPVIIRGNLLNLVTIQGVTFGGIPAQSYSVISDTEIRATPPSGLVAGRYPVRVLTNFAGTRQHAEYVVVNAPQWFAAKLEYPQMNRPVARGMVFDAERNALGLSLHEASGATSFLYFLYVNGQWQPYTQLTPTNHFSASLTADGREWILANYREVLHVDATTLATTATGVSPINGCCDGAMLNKFSLSSDGTIAMFGDYQTTLCGATLYLYEPRSRNFRTVPNFRPCIAWMGASGDGSRLLVHPGSSTAGTEVLSLDTVSGTLSPTSLSLYTTFEPQLSRTGSRIVLDRVRVYDANLAYIGNLPVSTDASIVSPDGTRAYTYQRIGSVMRTFDLQAAPVNGFMPEIGSAIPLAGDPGFDDIWPERFRMATTPDGRAVFFAGGLRAVVQPTP